MKILGIDDNEDLLDLCEIALSSEGHDYTAINNGREGLQEIKDKKFDIVLLDLSMPEFSGVDVIDALVKEDIMNKQKIVIFTASPTSDKLSQPFFEKGVHKIMTKPVDVDMLLEQIRKIASE